MKYSMSELYNEHTERMIIGLLLADSSKGTRIFNDIKVEALFDKRLRLIYQVMLELKEQDKPIDVVSVPSLLKFKNSLDMAGGYQFINELAMSYDTAFNIDYAIKEIIKYSKKRLLLKIAKDIEDELESEDVDDLALKLNETSDKILNRTNTTNFQPLMVGGLEVMEQIETLYKKDKPILGVSTGFSSLDNVLNGLCGGRLYILAARPAQGKSLLAQQIAEAAALDNNQVLFFSLEMGNSEYAQRNMFRTAGITMEMISSGILKQEQVMDSLSSALGALPDSLYIIDDAECTTNTIEKNIIRCRVQNKTCDLVIVDYLQLMQSADKSKKDRYDIVTYNSNKLKQLARKYNVPILLLSQLSRQSETRQDKTPMMSDLRESGAIEQDADSVMFIHRPEVYEPNNPKARGLAQVIVAKNRQGRTALLNWMFNKSNGVKFLE